MAALAELVERETQTHTLEGLPMPVVLRTTHPMADEDLIAFSRRNRTLRIEQNAEGELEIMSPLGGEGGNLEVRVSADLELWTREHGGIAFGPSTGFRLPNGSVRSPDAAWLHKQEWELLSAEQRRGFVPLCPPFLIEIRSESDSLETLKEKMKMWIGNGAQLAWMIDPFAATVSIYRPGQSADVLVRPEWVEADAVVAGFRLHTERIWAK